MKALNQQKTELLRNILFITLGSLLYALNFDLFLEPGGISSGGVSGIAMIIVYAAHPKFLTVGILNAMINIPLFLCGLKKIGRHFFFGSLYSTVLTSVFLDLFARILPVPAVEPLVAALFGGVFMGVSLGLVFLGNASTGGVDIVARLMKLKFRNFPIGKIILCMDLTIAVITGVVYRDFNNTLYSVIAMVVSSMALDRVVYGMPSIWQSMGTPFTVPATSPVRTDAPISSFCTKMPSAGARSTRSPAKPPMRPGMFVFGRGEP